MTFYFGAFDTTSGENILPDAVYWKKYTEILSEYLKVQMFDSLNSFKVENGEWPYLNTEKPVFVFLNDRDTKHTGLFEKYSFLHKQSELLGSTHMARGVTGTCNHVILDSGVQCRIKPHTDLLSLSVYGTYGLCTMDRSRYCNKFIFESTEQCMKYRSEFGNTVNFIVTDHSLQDEDYPENSINAAYYNNLQNIVTYNEKCHGTAPDASLRWPGDHRIYFFKNSRIHRYDEQKQVVDYVFDLKQQKDLFGNINAALTNGTKTVLFKDCYVWEYQSTHYGVGEEPSFSLSEKIDLADRFPGLPCNIDAAFSMYGRNFFFKGCLYYELVPKTIFNETSGIESLGGEITKAQDIYDWGLQIDTEKLVVDLC